MVVVEVRPSEDADSVTLGVWRSLRYMFVVISLCSG